MIDTIKDILSQTKWHASRRISELHKALGIPQNKRGRKPVTDENRRAEYLSQHGKDRRKQLKQCKKCIKCARDNDRFPKVHCSSCATKDSAKRRKQTIIKRLESNE
jgi:hypothetical protein